MEQVNKVLLALVMAFVIALGAVHGLYWGVMTLPAKHKKEKSWNIQKPSESPALAKAQSWAN